MYWPSIYTKSKLQVVPDVLQESNILYNAQLLLHLHQYVNTQYTDAYGILLLHMYIW